MTSYDGVPTVPRYTPEDDWSPAMQRKFVLAHFACSEELLRSLRAVRDEDVAEARWRIEHEHKAQIEWAKRRREFMLDEVLPNRQASGCHTVSGHRAEITDVDVPDVAPSLLDGRPVQNGGGVARATPVDSGIPPVQGRR
jgi:hypothetical protein